ERPASRKFDAGLSVPLWLLRLNLALNLAFAGCGAESLSIRGDYPACIGAVGSVLCGRTFDGNGVTELHGCASPAGTLKQMGGAHFESPVGNLSAFIFDVHIEPHVRIRPINLCDSACHLYLLV